MNFLSKFNILTFILLYQNLFAQTCTPDATNKSLFAYPKGSVFKDGFWYMPTAYEGVGYSVVSQVFLPKDTLIQTPGSTTKTIVPVSHTQVDSITGIPPGMRYSCNPSDCKFLAEKAGCIVLYGTPPAGSIGRYQIRIYGRTEVKVFGIPVVLPGSLERFIIEVADKTTDLAEQQLAQVLVYPNPATHELRCKTDELTVTDLELIFLNGSTKKMNFSFLENECVVPLSQLAKGFYLLKITTDKGIAYRKVAIE